MNSPLCVVLGAVMLSLENLRKNDQGSTFSLVQININKYIYIYINIYINIYYTFYSFLSSFVYYTHVKFVFNEASEQLLQDDMSDNVHLGEFYACYIFSFSLSLSLLITPPPTPHPTPFRCVT